MYIVVMSKRAIAAFKMFMFDNIRMLGSKSELFSTVYKSVNSNQIDYIFKKIT